MRNERFVAFALSLGLVLPVGAVDAQARSVDARGVRRIATFAYPETDRPRMDIGGTDLAFHGRYIYAAEQGRDGNGGGIHIYLNDPKRVKKLSYLPCGGWQNDVAVVRPGLIAIGYHAGPGNCGTKGGGVSFIDVDDARRPRLLGSTPPDAIDSEENLRGVHTITPLPGTSYVYASPGSAFTQDSTAEVVVDASDPRQPKIAARFETRTGCHDVTFSVRQDQTLGFCSGVGGTEVWDMAEPLSPRLLSLIAHPFHSFHHSSAVTSDGSLLVIGTETAGNECMGGPTGALIAYDITAPELPVYRGFFGAPRGRAPIYTGVLDQNFDTLCAPHLFNFRPKSRILVSGNGSGGVSVVDFSEPSAPTEVGHYMSPDMPMVFAAYWHQGRVFSNGATSFDAFAVDL